MSTTTIVVAIAITAVGALTYAVCEYVAKRL